MRLDSYLVENGYFESRNRALEAIKSGKVFVDGNVVKPSLKYNDSMKLEVANEKFYVSRAGRKLEVFLEEYPLVVQRKKVLDVGSSTGGFAQILLENDVSSLVCVDVGRDQLHYSLRERDNLKLYEETDIRDFRDEGGFDLVTCDVSFISLLEIIDYIDRLAKKDIVLLYKPQFEVGKNAKRDSKGVVQDRDAIRYNMQKFEDKAKEFGWRQQHKVSSKIKGKEGNEEYFYHFTKDDL
ncbi:MAG: TlyA family RNA methyltransferase [Campylobacterales bacterium]|nr:TlyA family RNA methyltransferase [Campylobacterales bacterium]